MKRLLLWRAASTITTDGIAERDRRVSIPSKLLDCIGPVTKPGHKQKGRKMNKTKFAVSLLISIVLAGVMAGTALAIKPLTTLVFDEVPFQPVDGLSVSGVDFKFQVGGVSSTDADYNSFGPPPIAYVQCPCMEGDAAGTLTLTFDKPTTEVEFGVALNTNASLPAGATVDLHRPGVGLLRQTVSLATAPGTSFTEGLFSYSGPAVKTVVITFDSANAGRFALDNLTYHKHPKS